MLHKDKEGPVTYVAKEITIIALLFFVLLGFYSFLEMILK
jgi:hypothetical protein